MTKYKLVALNNSLFQAVKINKAELKQQYLEVGTHQRAKHKKVG